MSPVYRVLLYFKPTYCIRPYFGLAYCVPFNNNNTFYLRFHFHEEGTKIQFVEWTGRLILAKSVVLCFLDSCSVFDPYNSYLVFKMNSGNKSVRAKRERENNLALFNMSWLLCFLVKIAPFKSKIWCLCTIEHDWLFAYCVPTLCILRTVWKYPEYRLPNGGCHPLLFRANVVQKLLVLCLFL